MPPDSRGVVNIFGSRFELLLFTIISDIIVIVVMNISEYY